MKTWNALVRMLSGHVLAPEDEAAWMIQARTGRSVFAHPLTPLFPEDRVVLLQWVEGRKAGHPLAYLTGTAFLWGRPLRVLPGVFIPRPESEALVAALLGHLPSAPLRMVDLGTGTGALLLALLVERPQAKGIGVDISWKALSVARENARRWKVEERAHWIRARGEALPLPADSVDAVIANPPYVPEGWESPDPAVKEEPAEALFSPGGVRHLRAWLQEVLRILRPGGWGVMEISPVILESVREVMDQARVPYTLVRDFSGEVRGVLFQKT